MAKSQKRKVGKLTKKQIGFQYMQLMLGQIQDLANGVRDVLEKGRAVDATTRLPIDIGCAPSDVRKAGSLEQNIALDDLISTWATEPEHSPKSTSNKTPRK